jgi:hypothetical protein
MNSSNTRWGHKPAGRAARLAHRAGGGKRAMIKILHTITSDSPDGQAWPPPDGTALWVIERRAGGYTLWRAIQLVHPPVADIATAAEKIRAHLWADRVRGRAVQAAGLPGPRTPSSSIHRNSGTTPDAAGRFAGHDMTGDSLHEKIRVVSLRILQQRRR